MFVIAAMLAWFLRSYDILNTTDKRRKLIAVMGFIMMSVSLLIILTTIFSACIAFSLSLEEFGITNELRGDIACFIDQSGSCTECEGSVNFRCPEWSKDDVTRIIQTQAKSGASLAAIFLIYASGCLRYGLNQRTHISNYMIEFV